MIRFGSGLELRRDFQRVGGAHFGSMSYPIAVYSVARTGCLLFGTKLGMSDWCEWLGAEAMDTGTLGHCGGHYLILLLVHRLFTVSIFFLNSIFSLICPI